MRRAAGDRSDGAVVRLLRRIYGLLLGRFPTSVREEYAAEMWATARRLEEEVRARGRRLDLLRFWLKEDLSILRSLFHAHRDRARGGTPHRSRASAAGRGSSRRWVSAVAVDLRYATRSAFRRPGYAALAVLTIALGIGANTAFFSVLDGVLFETLPGLDHERLVHVWEENLGQGGGRWEIAPADFEDYRARTTTLAALGGYGFPNELTYITDAEPRVIRALPVTANFFDVVGAEALMGRTFLESEKDPDGVGVVVLSYAFWRSQLGGDRRIVGRTVRLNDEQTLVVGVMPPRFHVQARPVDLWFPVWAATDQSWSRTWHYWYGVGRLADGFTAEDAERDLLNIARQLGAEHPATNTGHLIELVPLRDAVVGDVRTALLVLMGVVGFVLLIACSNVANMSLVQATNRRRELAVRAALGASRGELVRLAFAEGLIIAALGGTLGLGFAYLGLDALVSLSPLALPGVSTVSVDGSVLAFTGGATLLTALFLSLAPALSISRTDFVGTLKDGGRGATVGPEQRRLQRALLVVQLSLAVSLLVGAGLMLKSFMHLQAVDPGVRLDNVLTARITLPNWRYEDDAVALAFWDRLTEQVEALPGVRGASLTSVLPIRGGGWGSALTTDSPDQPGIGNRPAVRGRVVHPGYFRLMGIPLRDGRTISQADVPTGTPVVVINETAARRFWPDGAVGQRLKLGVNPDEAPWIEIVGVVRDIKEQGLAGDVLPAVYLPNAQSAARSLRLVVRTEIDPVDLTPAVKNALAEIDPLLPLQNVQTMKAVAGAAVERERSTATLLGIFAGIATLLAAFGVYGVISYSVARRSFEIAVRMALGANSGTILKSVVGEVFYIAAAAVALGLLASAGLTRVLASMLYEVSALDPLTFTAIPLMLLAVALLAAYMPARRAAGIDPAVALQEE